MSTVEMNDGYLFRPRPPGLFWRLALPIVQTTDQPKQTIQVQTNHTHTKTLYHSFSTILENFHQNISTILE